MGSSGTPGATSEVSPLTAEGAPSRTRAWALLGGGRVASHFGSYALEQGAQCHGEQASKNHNKQAAQEERARYSPR